MVGADENSISTTFSNPPAESSWILILKKLSDLVHPGTLKIQGSFSTFTFLQHMDGLYVCLLVREA